MDLNDVVQILTIVTMLNCLGKDFMTRHDLQKTKELKAVYDWLRHYNPELLDKIFPSSHKKWSLELCKQDALNYNTRNEWRKNSPGAHTHARKNNLVDECCSHMTSNKWTFQRCKQDALKYKTKSKWEKNSGSAYKSAIRNKWIDVCCSHMEPCKYGRKLVINLDTKQIFESVTKAAESVGSHIANILYGLRKTGKHKGYQWAYCDEKGNIIK